MAATPTHDETAARAFRATVLGYPRIGTGRELKRALEGYWAGRIDPAELAATAAGIRAADWRAMAAAGLDSVPVNTFSYYDQMLDTAVMVGAVPERFAGLTGLDRYFAMARGTAEAPALEMTKWFDTNYHYLVPELDPGTEFRLDASKVLGELAQARELGVPARPVIIGPLTFLHLAKPSAAAPDGWSPQELLDALLPCYADLLARLRHAGAEWVQFDEPVLVTDLDQQQVEQAAEVYRRLAQTPERPAILLASYFGDLGPALAPLARSGIDGLAVDLVRGGVESLASVPELSGLLVAAGVVNGRNIWRTDPDAALARLREVQALAGSVAVSTSCSLQHVPYTVAAESDMDPALRSWLAFAVEKTSEVVDLAAALDGDESPALRAARAAIAARRADPRVRRTDVRDRIAGLDDSAARRAPAAQRAAAQARRTPLPAYPTTTIGSFPQTPAIRKSRAAFRAGTLDADGYTAAMRAEIDDVIALQTELGLDVLVHGEPERNDMVQYFAEQLDGYAASQDGWVLSYGSRCVRPPILYGDVHRSEPMTVPWIRYAASRTDKPVKGMLTGPVTMLAWSFVRDDQPLADTAMQVALAISDETVDLEAAGAPIIQVDEPALRELLPLRAADRPGYLEWAVRAFRLATCRVGEATAVHTHLCYSEFGDVIGAIDALDADVTSIEAARSRMEVLDDLRAVGYSRGVGPGVYDIHSPRVPDVEEILSSLRLAAKVVPVGRLWVNPDCGLKTRKPEEVRRALGNMVAAAKELRA